MTIEEIRAASIEDIQTRRAEILSAVDAEDADLEAMTEEARNLNAELESRRAAAEQRQAIRNAVADGDGVVFKKMEERKMPEIETRNTKAYIDAYANYIKTGKDEECRALLSTNGTDSTSPALTGYVPVPEMVESTIKTAWERNRVMELVRKTYIKGNLKVGFELSASGAVIHKEGRAAPDEEVITLGIVEMIPQSIKKWITISDEALDLSGEDFLRYIYDELTYRIAKKCEEELIGIIAALPDTATSSSVSAAVVKEAPGTNTIAQAMGLVYGSNLKVVMNRGTWAQFLAAQKSANYSFDIFEGLDVVFSDALPVYGASDVEEDYVYAIVVDFYEGVQANFPNGEGISIKVDNLSLAEKDLVKFVGREFVALGAVADKRFALITVPDLTP